MIYEITYKNGSKEWFNATNTLHLLQCHKANYNVSAMSSGGFGTTHYQNTTNDNRKHKR